MKIQLTKGQIIAIQKLLSAHAGINGINPKGFICFNAFKSIENQTNLNQYSQEEEEVEKCSYRNCNNKSIGYFVGSGYGLFLCKKHKMGTLKKEIGGVKEE